jgi:tetratricopeptide (TPR) repeat protein
VGALVNLLRIYEKLEKADGALEVVDRLGRLESADPSVFLEAGNACISFGEYQKAIELYERFLVRKPDDVRTLSNLASCYARLGHVDSARIGYKAALSIDPLYEMAHNNLLTLEKAVAE